MSEISEAQLNANRANGQLSHGPVTPEGKARSSGNAYRHGLTARKMILKPEDLERYQSHVQSFLDQHQPQTIDECALVQIVADCHWRIDRAMTIEDNLMAFLSSEILENSSLPNLSLYLTRFYNMMNRSLKQLQDLQAKRQAEERQKLAEAVLLAKYQKMLEQPFDPQENGFVFSTAEIDREIRTRETLKQAELAEKYNFDLARYRFRREQEAKNKAA
jgi:hypothetical protein